MSNFTIIPAHTIIQPIIMKPIILNQPILQPIILVPPVYPNNIMMTPKPKHQIFICPGAPKKKKKKHFNVQPIPFFI